ncbi:MAG: polysaccharide deacetylase family protein [Leuconostoc gelidum]|uniref:polysaccharide deacetylase family protein n=1 Tax=Leuconostoc gelidum TaxID=1244 RepID=UPI00021921C9|nr:polysaccharide deacetylase family protein [Leuconostoc gelidum]AFS40496.1 biofilm PIA synthesis deacetylase icab precursor [Leuconostoc gelidum JB7]MBZ5991519.1 polysaccharide deacetylase family protein [Leuconostoc gelidum subsp. gelidum]USP18067.1 polysaccharide deacetylase family protein [Leuconostoc gelidum subsp. aenigmaticum]GMA68139.1 intercellular adhesion protein [Leuconostoc gelidum subsp. gelidum]
MTKKKRRLVLYMILTMVALLILMFFSGLQQGKARQKVTQKVDYSYLNFAEKNSNVKDGVIVLAYHRILKNNATVSFAQKISKNPQLQEYNVSQDEFIKQMNWLKKNHISIWSMSQFIEHTKNNTIRGRHVVITFDDIDTTLPRNASQKLADLSIPFTFFVITGKVGQNLDGEQLASWSEITQLAVKSNVTVGLHTNDLHYQVDNDPILSSGTLSKKAIIKDYQKSKQKLEKQLSINPTVFAYPYGSPNKALTEYMSSHGMAAIFLLEPGIVSNNMPDILKRVPRFIVTNSNFTELQKWLEVR